MAQITLTQARDRIGVSKETFRQIVRRGTFTIYSNPRDGRQRLVDEAEVERYLQPKVIVAGKQR